MKKLTITLMLVLGLITRCYATDVISVESLSWLFNQTIGYHFSYSNKPVHVIAYQGNLAFLNYAYAYRINSGSQFYVGTSTFGLILWPDPPFDTKIQYGRIFSKRQNLLKVSFDYFFAPLDLPGSGIATYSTVGIFVEKNFEQNLPMLGLSFGVSLNWSIWDIFIIGDKNRKYFRKYER
jgi:hypothetical protein